MNTIFRKLFFTVAVVSGPAVAADPAAVAADPVAADPAYVKSVQDWRGRVEASLRKDNGWLTLAGRYVLKPG